MVLTVDVSLLFEEQATKEQRWIVAQEIKQALQSDGLFYMKNHSVKDATAVFQAARDFFALNSETKQALSVDSL